MLVIKCRHCGRDMDAFPRDVKSGRKKFCSRECRAASKPATTHGMSRTPLYSVWRGMRSRCQNPNHPSFAYYGRRGIAVCDEWDRSFLAFHQWAVETGYEPGLEIDRRENDGPYSPDNCRWATRRQQMRNQGKRSDAETSRLKGVSRHSQNGTWVAQIGIDGRTVYVGSFATEEEAARAYDDAAKARFGEFANLNFPNG